MGEEELDELFRRFVQKRDLGAVGELFDSAAPQLARIAWHLTHDANGVEDLVQATFLSALGSAREFDVERRVMPWLLGILVNHARSARRAAARKPEVLAADVVDRRSPEAELERREVREVVERAVAELPDTYRDVVSTWLVEGTSPTEIAQRTGKPASTVRVQLRRGLELLRNGLPAGVAGLLATNGWSATSLATSREVVLAHAARVARTLVPTSAVVAGGLLVTSKWLFLGAAAALVTAAGVGWFVQRDGAEPAGLASAPVVDTNEARASAPIPAAAVDERSEVAVPTTSNEHEALATLAPGWWLIGDIEGVAASDRARLTSPTDKDWSADVSGAHFEVEIPAIFEAFRSGSRGANTFTVRYDSPRFMPTHVQVTVPEQVNFAAAHPGERVELHMQLTPTLAQLSVTGRVVAPRTFDVSNALVALYALDSSGKLVSSPTEWAHCSDDGSFRVRSSADGAHALAAALPGLRPATRSIEAQTHGVIDLGEIALERGEHLAGSTTPAARAVALTASLTESEQSLYFGPLAFANQEFIDRTRLAWSNGRFDWDRLSVAVEVNGTFRIEGLAPLTYRIGMGMESHLGNPDEVARLQYTTDSEDPQFVASRDDIVLEGPRCRIRIDVRADGVPVDGASVSLGFGDDGYTQSGFRGHLADLVWNGERSATVRVVKEGFVSSEIVVTPAEAVPGALRVIELTRQTGLTSLVLRPRIACTNSVDLYVLSLVPLDKERGAALDSYPSKTVNVSEGEWRFDNVAPGRYRIELAALGSMTHASWCLAPSPEIELAAGESVVRELPFVNGGRLAFTVLDAQAKVAHIEVSGVQGKLDWSYFDAQKGESQSMSTRDGKFGFQVGARIAINTVLEPGVRTLTVRLKDAERTQRTRTIDIVPGQTTELVVDFSKPDER